MSKKAVKQKRPERLGCYKCKHLWRYTGNRPIFVSCPICHYKLRIAKARAYYRNASMKLKDGLTKRLRGL